MDLFLLLPASLLLFRDTLGSQYCQEHEDTPNSTITGSSVEPFVLGCYREGSSDAEPLHCTWSAGMELVQNKLSYCCDTCKKHRSFLAGNESWYIVPRNNFYLEKNLTFWVEATAGGSRVRSKKLYIVPKNSVRYNAPRRKDIELARSSGILTLTWENPEVRKIDNQIRYRRLTSGKWNQTICNSYESKAQDTCTIHLESTAAFKLQIRRILHSHGSIWSEWSKIIFIPAEITQSLHLHWEFTDGFSPSCPGQRNVKLQWQPSTEPNVGVTSYSLIFQPALDKSSFTQKLHNNSTYQTAISLAPYNISIVAFNKVGASQTETVTIPAAPPEGTPRLNITVQNNRTLKALWIEHNVRFYCIILELVSVGILSNTCQPRKQLRTKNERGMLQKVFEGLEPLKRYQVTVHTNSTKESSGCQSMSGYTIGSGAICTQEQPPIHGPSKVSVTNIRKNSIVLEWDELSLGQCQGSMQNYLIIYRDRRNHTHTATVNSSTLSFTLLNLNSSTLYTVEICGVTTVGIGAKTLRNFQTRDYDENELPIIITAASVSVMIAVFIGASVCYCSIKRSIHIIFPKVPDPVNSLAVKYIHTNAIHWADVSDDRDVTDVLVVMVTMQSDTNTPLSSENAEDEMMSMLEEVDFCTTRGSFSSESNVTFAYKRQMGTPLGTENDQSSEKELKEDLGTEATELLNNDTSPLCLQPYSGSGLNLCGNMISLLTVYDRNLAEEEREMNEAD